MDEILADILQTCLIRIDAGASVDDCLAAYPQQRDQLEAPLKAAAQLRVLPRPVLPAAARATLEARMLALAAERRAAGPATPASNGQLPPAPRGVPDPAALLAGLLRALGYRGPLALTWLRVAAIAIAIVLTLVVSGGALAAARAVVRALQGPTTTLPVTPFVLDGPIEQIAPERWVVNGIAIALDAQTAIEGTPTPGAVAHVSGEVQPDALLLARSITVDIQQPAATSVPTSPNPPAPISIPTTLPPPPPDTEPGDGPKPDKPAKPDKPDKPGKPGKGKGSD